MLSEAWRWLVHRLSPQEEAINTAQDQDLLNRINTGSFRPVPVAGTGRQSPDAMPYPGAALRADGSAQGSAPATVGDVAAEPPPQASTEELRERRLAHFEQSSSQ
mmetsp:Transcript_8085/g.18919  ORF Transcript_8085/g.18919 Transcript_8085/m.18919 type:complete len:105 (-) Transcript_8085:134-448(-)